jgi:hypothetical protein
VVTRRAGRQVIHSANPVKVWLRRNDDKWFVEIGALFRNGTTWTCPEAEIANPNCARRYQLDIA